MHPLRLTFLAILVLIFSGCGGGGAGATATTGTSSTAATSTITSFMPTIGATGDSVTITGANFSAALTGNTVKFNGTQATVTAATATSITATVPSGATSGTLTVTTNSVVATSSSSFTTMMGGAVQNGPLSLTTVVTTLAGNGAAGSIDGTGTAASFYGTLDTTTDGTNLYVADKLNHLIRKVVIATGVVTTLAGSRVTMASVDGTGIAASFANPSGVTTDGTNLYVVDTGKIRKIIIATGEVSTLAGNGSCSPTFSGTDGTGAAAQFCFNSVLLSGITTDGTNLYLVDGSTIRKVVIATGVVTTLAGSGVLGSTDGIGTAATFHVPSGITTDGTNLYVTDGWAHYIRKIVIATGVVTTLAGSGASNIVDGTGTAASVSIISGITTDGTSLYVSDVTTIRKIVIATGVVTTLAGSAGSFPVTNGTGATAKFFSTAGITTDGLNLYVAADNYSIRRVQ
jgi:hypothetical protein